MRKASLLLLTLLLAIPAWAQNSRPELILGLDTDFDTGRVVFTVAGSGCTGKKDFRPVLEDETLTLLRMHPDNCKAMPQRVQIEFTLDELGISPHRPFTLGNRIIVNENLTKQ